MIVDENPVTNLFISTPPDMGDFNCGFHPKTHLTSPCYWLLGVFLGGVLGGALEGSGFVREILHILFPFLSSLSS